MGGGGIIACWQEFPCLPLFFLKTFFYPSPSSGSPLNPAPLPSLRALSLRGLADLHNGGKGIFALKIFFSIISRAFYYCLTCHADVKYPELIRECECSRGTMMQYFCRKATVVMLFLIKPWYYHDLCLLTCKSSTDNQLDMELTVL